MPHFTSVFCSFALVSLALVIFSRANTIIALHQIANVTCENEQTYITYRCPDMSERRVAYTGRLPDEDLVLYVKPKMTYPFDPDSISVGHPRLQNAGLLCAGTCSLWAYVMYLAALKQGN